MVMEMIQINYWLNKIYHIDTKKKRMLRKQREKEGIINCSVE